MQIPLEQIIVKKRIRKELGNINALADSMKRVGQISPIVITEQNLLLAGGRRLEAAKLLGWRTINAVTFKLPEGVTNLEIEMAENSQRRDFTAEESGQAMRQLYRQQHPGFLRRIWNAIAGFFSKLLKRRKP